MMATSAAFQAAVRTSHTAAVEAEILYAGAVIETLLVESGSVAADSRRDGPLRSCTLELVSKDPATTWSNLNLPGAEIRIRRGVVLPAGAELVALGVFVFTDPERVDGSGTRFTLNGNDRAARISRARFTEPYAIAAGTDYGDAGAALLRDRWADCPIGFGPVGRTLSSPVVFEHGESSDPWKSAKQLFEAIALDLYFDGEGVARLRVIPDPATATPAAVYEDGEAQVVLETKEAVQFDQTYNGVIVQGEGTGTDPVRGEAWDDDASSATYRYGPFGQVPRFYTSTFITTADDANQTARMLLNKSLGRMSRVEWPQIVDPSLEPYDVVQVEVDGTLRTFMIDSLTYPLAIGEAMSIVTRETRTA